MTMIMTIMMMMTAIMTMMDLFNCSLLSICSTAGPYNEDDDDDDANDDDGMYRDEITTQMIANLPDMITDDIINYTDLVRSTIHIIAYHHSKYSTIHIIIATTIHVIIASTLRQVI